MITISSASQNLTPALLQARGGFAWWYLDLVDAPRGGAARPEAAETGNGLVLIWSFGLPFLPGYASDARSGRAPAAASRPSLNLCTYKNGEPDFYLLAEFPPEQAEWDAEHGTWRLGDSTFQVERVEGRVHLRAEIDCPVPGGTGRLTGTIQAGGPLRGNVGGVGDGPHVWSPVLTAAEGAAELWFEGEPVLSMCGRAYHDRNGSEQPLHELGISRWRWGRLAFPDREVCWYLLDPDDPVFPAKALLMTVQRDGSAQVVENVPVEWSRWRFDRYGLTWHRELVLRGDLVGDRRVEVDHASVVDRGPFYLRWLVSGREPDTGATARGIAEQVVPQRVDLERIRPFVAMRVFQVEGENSPMLPLFCGPKAGRVGRWLGSRRPSLPLIPEAAQ